MSDRDQPIGRRRIIHHAHLTHSRNSFAVGGPSKRIEFHYIMHRNNLPKFAIDKIDRDILQKETRRVTIVL